MPVSPAALIVARFLKANHYEKTLEAFIQEAGLAEDTGILSPGEWTIEQILQEKEQFDKSLKYQKHDSQDAKSWSANAPTQAHEPTLSVTSNVLCVYGDPEAGQVSVTTADRAWKVVSGMQRYATIDELSSINESPILSIVAVGTFFLSTDMSGRLSVRDRTSHKLIDSCRHHTKYAVQVASVKEDDIWLMATAGWDQKIHFYAPNDQNSSSGIIGEPIHSHTLPTNPESILFVRHPDNFSWYLVASRRDSTHLYYFKITSTGSKFIVSEAGRQNLAPHSNAWVAFTPCSLSKCPRDPTLLAAATSHLPHMKLIVVRLLFPDSFAVPSESSGSNQASAARLERLFQDREDAAIKLHVTTMAPQTPYSTPQVVWRPDASGLFVNGDDGVIRGIEMSSGKIVASLQGHEGGTKVRTLWAGKLRESYDEQESEILVSGGFDKKLLVWRS